MTAPKRKSVALQVAEHLSCDYAEMRDYDYHPGRWTPKVYCGMDGNNYWSAGAKPPKHREGDDGMVWVQVPSSWPNNPPLWRGSASGKDESR